MASFYPPVFTDSVFSSNDPNKIPGFLDEFFPDFDQIYTDYRNQPLNHQEGSSLNAISNESSFLEQEQSTSNIITPFVTAEKQRSTESFTSMAENDESENKITQNLVNFVKKRKSSNGSPSNSTNSKEEDKQVKKCKKQKRSKEGRKEEGSEEASKGYIHVRARRGQATDTHSLAERARREKISEKMKTLQALVPGCDKVTGKAPMLDEIINYVQSLQNQVELLSMKLASLDPMLYILGLMDHHAISFGTEDATSSQYWGLDDLHQNNIINQFGLTSTNSNNNLHFFHE